MKGRAMFILFSVVSLLGATLWIGCKSDETTSPGGSTILAPTGLKAYSASSTSVALLWNLSASESDPSFNNYLIRAKDPTGAISATTSAAKGTPNAVVSSLTEGVIYTFVVRSTITGGSVSSDSASVQWSPARRYTTDSTNGPPIQVYEFRSTLGASGLQFNSAAGAYAKVRSLSTSNPNRFLCDIYVDSIQGGAICLKNIALLPGYPRNTFFSTDTRDASDLNDPQAAPPDTTSYQLNRLNLPGTTVTQSKIFYARSTTDNKYVRILVQRNPATQLLYYGSGSDRYVVLQLSYQNAPGNWFARPVKIDAQYSNKE